MAEKHDGRVRRKGVDKSMICTYRYEAHTYEFDATSKADETKKVWDICKERGWKIKDMKREV